MVAVKLLQALGFSMIMTLRLESWLVGWLVRVEGWWYLFQCYTDGGDVYADASHYANAAKLGPTFVLICTNTVSTRA